MPSAFSDFLFGDTRYKPVRSLETRRRPYASASCRREIRAIGTYVVISTHVVDYDRGVTVRTDYLELPWDATGDRTDSFASIKWSVIISAPRESRIP